MTFHDETFHDYEQQALQAKETLYLWLGTIAPVPQHICEPLMTMLETLTAELQWPPQIRPGSEGT